MGGLGTVVGVEKKAANGEVSFVAVKLVYTPAAAEMSDGVAITAGTTFYRAKNAAGTYSDKLFHTLDAAIAVAGAGGITETFTNGVMYYRLNLRDMTQTD